MDSKDFEAILAKLGRSKTISEIILAPFAFIGFFSAALAGPTGGWTGGWWLLCTAMGCFVWYQLMVSETQHYNIRYELALVQEALRELQSRTSN